MSARPYDAIVIGGGPAGASAAATMARSGLKVLLLEKKIMPRMKACAGGVPRKAAEFLGLDLSPLAGPPIRGLTLSWRGEDARTVRGEEIQGWVVKREEFDRLLLDRARESGAEVLEGCGLLDLEDRGGRVRASTARGVFTAPALVGADGGGSLVARRLGFSRRRGDGFAIETRVKVSSRVLEERNGLLSFDLGAAPGGYGWIFPLADSLNVGVGTRRPPFKKLLGCLQAYLAREGFPRAAGKEIRGSTLACGIPPFGLQRGRCCLAGDAAGLVDSLTGEGIYSALLSGRLAGEAVADFLAGTAPLSAYRGRVRRKLGGNLLAARIIARLTDLSPRRAYDLSSKSDRRIRGAMAVVQGEISYFELLRKKIRPRR
ncbi:MAG: geranylgeranyl reductase family protein [Candidatus Erginobacter occultus]|nr:geranylgeranyl reductase family protein [Candidatus Erginobacter occultus]